MTILITERLELHPWKDADLEMLATLGADPSVVRWVGDGQPWTREHAVEVHARMLAHWAAHGFGWRVAVTRARNEPIGFIALNFAPASTPGLAPDDYEIGWWLARAVWRRGYGTEGAGAVRDEAFERLGAPSIVARIQPANAASRAVAEAIGMRLHFETVDSLGIPVVVYRLDRPPRLSTATADG